LARELLDYDTERRFRHVLLLEQHRAKAF